MHFIVNLLISLPARIASHFSWAGPLIMRLIVGYTFMQAVVMVVAIRSAKWGDVDSLETLLGFEEATYFAGFMWLAIAGPGAASLDRWLTNAAGHREAT